MKTVLSLSSELVILLTLESLKPSTLANTKVVIPIIRLMGMNLPHSCSHYGDRDDLYGFNLLLQKALERSTQSNLGKGVIAKKVSWNSKILVKIVFLFNFQDISSKILKVIRTITFNTNL